MAAVAIRATAGPRCPAGSWPRSQLSAASHSRPSEQDADQGKEQGPDAAQGIVLHRIPEQAHVQAHGTGLRVGAGPAKVHQQRRGDGDGRAYRGNHRQELGQHRVEHRRRAGPHLIQCPRLHPAPRRHAPRCPSPCAFNGQPAGRWAASAGWFRSISWDAPPSSRYVKVRDPGIGPALPSAVTVTVPAAAAAGMTTIHRPCCPDPLRLQRAARPPGRPATSRKRPASWKRPPARPLEGVAVGPSPCCASKPVRPSGHAVPAPATGSGVTAGSWACTASNAATSW